MISETPILVIVESITPSALELETTGFWFPAEDEDSATIAEEEFGLLSPLLAGTIVEELETSGTGAAGLLSSEQAENMLSAETQVPTASHFLVFMSAFLF
jgi:hypothetical protein